MTLRVAERFYSLQGEGARAGEASAFIRLSGCSAKHACWEAGVRCDTEFESGEEVAVESLLAWVAGTGARWVVWTGGEPLDQLTAPVLEAFRAAGLSQALETSGVRPLRRPLRDLFDWVACSPKVAEHVLARHFGDPGLRVYEPRVGFTEVAAHVHELRYVRHPGQGVPEPALLALRRYLSPHADGGAISAESLRWAVGLCLRHPDWRLSVQQHKLIGLL